MKLSKNTSQPAPEKREQLSKKKLSYKEQRELEALPARLSVLEAEQAGIRAQLADGRLYASDPQAAARLHDREGAIDDELLALMERQQALAG